MKWATFLELGCGTGSQRLAAEERSRGRKCHQLLPRRAAFPHFLHGPCATHVIPQLMHWQSRQNFCLQTMRLGTAGPQHWATGHSDSMPTEKQALRLIHRLQLSTFLKVVFVSVPLLLNTYCMCFSLSKCFRRCIKLLTFSEGKLPKVHRVFCYSNRLRLVMSVGRIICW